MSPEETQRQADESKRWLQENADVAREVLRHVLRSAAVSARKAPLFTDRPEPPQGPWIYHFVKIGNTLQNVGVRADCVVAGVIARCVGDE